MSIIVKFSNNKIILYSKGADNILINLMIQTLILIIINLYRQDIQGTY